MSSKRHAPNPRYYWRLQLERLEKLDAALYAEIDNFRVQPWDGRVIAYGTALGRQLIDLLGNPYDYAASTFLSQLRRAGTLRKREVRMASHASAAVKRLIDDK
jgi:hypothetical protein